MAYSEASDPLVELRRGAREAMEVYNVSYAIADVAQASR